MARVRRRARERRAGQRDERRSAARVQTPSARRSPWRRGCGSVRCARRTEGRCPEAHRVPRRGLPRARRWLAPCREGASHLAGVRIDPRCAGDEPAGRHTRDQVAEWRWHGSGTPEWLQLRVRINQCSRGPTPARSRAATARRARAAGARARKLPTRQRRGVAETATVPGVGRKSTWLVRCLQSTR